LAEDDRLLALTSSAALRRRGFEVQIATDGEAALAMAKSERPDLILLDVIMPKLQGFDVLKQLKSDPDTTAIPVIMLTGLRQSADMEEAQRAGAAAYFVKSELRGDQLAAKVAEAFETLRRKP
jgi:CheY-like chemotaxis protein